MFEAFREMLAGGANAPGSWRRFLACGHFRAASSVRTSRGTRCTGAPERAEPVTTESAKDF